MLGSQLQKTAARMHGLLDKPRVATGLCLSLWIVPLLVIAVLAAFDPVKHSVTPVYHVASANWWSGNNLYGWELRRFHYLPVFAVMFSPFHFLPQPAGDILWRFVSAAFLATGIQRLLRRQTGIETERALLCISVVILPLCLGALRNGQANVIFGAFLLHAVACLPERRWWSAAAFMAVAVAVKPFGMVLVLLAAFIYAPLRGRLVLALAVLALFPFLFGSPEYVFSQHSSFLGSLRASDAVITEHRFADIGGLVRTFGAEIPPTLSKLIRVLAGAATLLLWLGGAARLREPLRALWLLTLAAGYLMLFNPMTEANSYVIFAPVAGLWAVAALNRREGRRLGRGIVLAMLSMGLLPTLLHPLFGNYFALFWYPLVTAAILTVLAYRLYRAEAPFPARPDSYPCDRPAHAPDRRRVLGGPTGPNREK